MDYKNIFGLALLIFILVPSSATANTWNVCNMGDSTEQCVTYMQNYLPNHADPSEGEETAYLKDKIALYQREISKGPDYYFEGYCGLDWINDQCKTFLDKQEIYHKQPTQPAPIQLPNTAFITQASSLLQACGKQPLGTEGHMTKEQLDYLHCSYTYVKAHPTLPTPKAPESSKSILKNQTIESPSSSTNSVSGAKSAVNFGDKTPSSKKIVKNQAVAQTENKILPPVRLSWFRILLYKLFHW